MNLKFVVRIHLPRHSDMRHSPQISPFVMHSQGACDAFLNTHSVTLTRHIIPSVDIHRLRV